MNAEKEERLKRIKGLQANVRMKLDKIDELNKGIENLAIEILKLKYSLKDLGQDE